MGGGGGGGGKNVKGKSRSFLSTSLRVSAASKGFSNVPLTNKRIFDCSIKIVLYVNHSIQRTICVNIYTRGRPLVAGKGPGSPEIF